MGFLPEYTIQKLNNRFCEKIVWFDQDRGGHIGADKFRQKYGYRSIFIPERCKVKDPFDFVKTYGKREFIQMFNQIL
jgi:DNA primase